MPPSRSPIPPQADLRRALTFGPERQVLWTGPSPLDTLEYVCGGLYGPDRAYMSKPVPLTYAPIGRPDIKAAWCARCRVPGVRAVVAAGRSATAR